MCLQINALNILPNSLSELYTYPPSWEFKLVLRDDARIISEQVTCEMLITAGRTKLVQNTFCHPFEHANLPQRERSSTYETIGLWPRILSTFKHLFMSGTVTGTVTGKQL